MWTGQAMLTGAFALDPTRAPPTTHAWGRTPRSSGWRPEPPATTAARRRRCPAARPSGPAPGAEDADPSGEVGWFEGEQDRGVEAVGPVGDVAGRGEAVGGAGGAQRDGLGSTVAAGDELGDHGDPAHGAAGGSALQVDDRTDATADEPPDDVEAGAGCGQGHGLEAGRHLLGTAGMEGGHEAAMAGVGGLQHVEHLGAADLADDDAVGTH